MAERHFDYRGNVVKPPRFVLFICALTGKLEPAWHAHGFWFRCSACGKLAKGGGW